MAVKTLTFKELEQKLAEMEAENEALKKAKQTRLSMKVSEKGALSVYGLGRFPVTLYHEQWSKLADLMPQIKDFIADNLDTLKSKE